MGEALVAWPEGAGEVLLKLEWADGRTTLLSVDEYAAMGAADLEGVSGAKLVRRKEVL